MEVSKTNTLSFYNDQGVLALSAKQGDTGRKFIFNIINDYELCDLTGYSVYMRMKKADKTEFQGEECCSIDGSKVIVDTSVGNGEQILSCPGMNLCELHLTDSDGKSVTTWNFIINVEARVHNGSNIISTDSCDFLDYVKKMEQIRNKNEENRIQNENERISAEDIRKSNENARQANEAQRIQETNDAIGQVQDLISEGNDVISDITDATEYAIAVGKDLEEKRDRGDFKGEKGEPGISMEGSFALEIDELGHLIIYYKDSSDIPSITLEDNGHLVYIIDN